MPVNPERGINLLGLSLVSIALPLCYHLFAVGNGLRGPGAAGRTAPLTPPLLYAMILLLSRVAPIGA